MAGRGSRAAVLLLPVVLFAPAQAAPAPAHHAALIVRAEGRNLATRCVTFTGPHISGYELLQRSGLPLDVQPYGTLGVAICRIDGSGCSTPRQACFCAYPESWGYWTRAPGQHRYERALLGASSRMLTDGSMDAWVWGRDGGPPPSPRMSFASVCRTIASGAAPSASASGGVRVNPVTAGGVGAASMAVLGTAILLRRRRVSR